MTAANEGLRRVEPSNLESLGFTPFFAQQFGDIKDPGLVPARVAAAQRGRFALLGCRSPFGALTGRLRRGGTDPSMLPTVGDWVIVRDGDGGTALITALLTRRTGFVRRAPGSLTEVQVIAANIDTVFVVTSANRDFNPRRIERYLTAVWNSGAVPVVVVNKIDVCPDLPALLSSLAAVAPNVPVIAASALVGDGLEQLRSHLLPGSTVALVGSSGVGKSSLVNRLLGAARQITHESRSEDDKGRHTTTHRELFVTHLGGLLIDTPGLRELGLWDEGEGRDRVFPDVEAVAARCRFHDCRHEEEPGCAVRLAIGSGELAEERLASYLKLEQEQKSTERQREAAVAASARQRSRSAAWSSQERDRRADDEPGPARGPQRRPSR